MKQIKKAKNLQLVNSGYIQENLSLSRQRLHQLRNENKIKAYDMKSKGGKKRTLFDLDSVRQHKNKQVRK